jgi:hypothetical protein
MEDQPSDRIQTSLSFLEQVAHLAWQRWETEGRPAGRNLYFWSWAEAEILARPHRPTLNQPGAGPTFRSPAP